MSKKEKSSESGSKTHNKKPAANSGRTLMHNVDPNTIYFTHARIRPQFTGCNKMIQDTIDEITSGKTKMSAIPYITVIENFEEVFVAADPKAKGKKNTANKRCNRKGDGNSDEEDGWMNAKALPTTTKSFYFSLNNRRLFLFKTLKQMGLLDTITVYVKPALEREKTKYQRKNCVLMAKVMSRKELEEAGEETPDEDDNQPTSGKTEVKTAKSTKPDDDKKTHIAVEPTEAQPTAVTTTSQSTEQPALEGNPESPEA